MGRRWSETTAIQDSKSGDESPHSRSKSGDESPHSHFSVVENELVAVEHCPPDVFEGRWLVAAAGLQNGRGRLLLAPRWLAREGGEEQMLDLLLEFHRAGGDCFE